MKSSQVKRGLNTQSILILNINILQMIAHNLIISLVHVDMMYDCLVRSSFL